jgi:hypothetical protein
MMMMMMMMMNFSKCFKIYFWWNIRKILFCLIDCLFGCKEMILRCFVGYFGKSGGISAIQCGRVSSVQFNVHVYEVSFHLKKK